MYSHAPARTNEIITNTQTADIIVCFQCYGMISAQLIMDKILYIIAGPLFLISLVCYLYLRIFLKPKYEIDIDDYSGFEDKHPVFAKYEKWSRFVLAAMSVAMLLLFLAAVT